MIILFVLGACKKDLKESAPSPGNASFKQVSSMKDLVVPAGFSWEMSREVNLSIGVSDTRYGNKIHQVAVYTGDPNKGGALVAQGAASSGSPFKTMIMTANTITSYYLVKTAPDLTKMIEKVAITGTNVNVMMGSTTPKLGKTATSPDCTTGCNNVYNNSSSNVSVSAGVTCLTGTFTGDLHISGTAVVRICGTATINNLDFADQGQLIVTSTGTLNFTSAQPMQQDGAITNFGIINTTGNINVNSDAVLTNYGTINVGQDLNPNGGSTTVNDGLIEVTSKCLVSAGAVFTNDCKLIVHDDFDQNGEFYNYGYIKCYMESTVQGGINQVFQQFNGAMLSTYDIQVNGTITGIGTTSLIKVSHDSKGNSSGLVSGNQSYCDGNGIEALFNATIGSGATTGCSLYIPTSDCNPEGNGTPPSTCTDSDNDGVCDSQDCYPNDATKAFCNYYPSENGRATVAFEDLWPYLGDYDMNDVVVSFNYNVVTNAQNNVVKVSANFTLRATGGVFQNGFAVQFPVSASSVTNVTGGTLEGGQTKAVIKIFNDMRSEMNWWNTVPSQPKSDTMNYSISFEISGGGVPVANFGLCTYNPFIWNGTPGFGRGYEVHLPGKKPTDLANSSLFGTGDDNTNPSGNKYYTSKNSNLPWAICIPERFDYPVEKYDINLAYLKFATWVQSSGTQYADWYKNLPGYRDPSKIY